MGKKDWKNNAEKPYPDEVKDLQKDEVNGKRRQKRKDKDYDKKYGDRDDSWN